MHMPLCPTCLNKDSRFQHHVVSCTCIPTSVCAIYTNAAPLPVAHAMCVLRSSLPLTSPSPHCADAVPCQWLPGSANWAHPIRTFHLQVSQPKNLGMQPDNVRLHVISRGLYPLRIWVSVARNTVDASTYRRCCAFYA